MAQYFIMLLCAHLLADFPLQINSIARRKRHPGILALHVAIHIVTTLAVLSLLDLRIPPAAIFAVVIGVGLLHGIIDFCKTLIFSDNLNSFLLDQFAHIIVLASAAWIIQSRSAIAYRPQIAHGIIYITGFFAIWNASSHFIDRFVAKYLPTQESIDEYKPARHKNASDWIGKFERILVFGFILMGYPEGIGFIIAGKSILRFQDAKKEKMSEYILIGTLLSISLAIGFTYLCRYAIRLF